MIHPKTYCGHFCSILSNLICPIFCCFASCRGPSYVYKDVCCFRNTAVLKSLVIPKLCNLKSPLVFVNYESSAKDKTTLKTPFAVIEDTHDKEKMVIVISIRGTSQPADVLIDTLARPESIWAEDGKNAPDHEQEQVLMDNNDTNWKDFKGNKKLKQICICNEERIKIMKIYAFYY